MYFEFEFISFVKKREQFVDDLIKKEKENKDDSAEDYLSIHSENEEEIITMNNQF